MVSYPEPFHTVEPYLEFITRNDLVVKIDGRTPRFKTTEKGLEVLRHFRELEAMIPDLRASNS